MTLLQWVFVQRTYRHEDVTCKMFPWEAWAVGGWELVDDGDADDYLNEPDSQFPGG